MIEDDRILSCKNVYNSIQKRFGFNKEYVKLQYIVANGTQYINTGYVPNSETKIETKFKVDQIFDDVSKNHQPLYGASVIYNSRAFEFWPQAYGFSCYDGNKYKDHTGVLLNQDNTVVQDRNVLNVNGTISTFSYQSFTSPSTLYIFATNRTSQGIVVYNYNNSNCYLYYLKISDNDVLVRDFIPVKRKNDNAIGLFDSVSNVFYENSGTGTFTAGPEIPIDDSNIPNKPANVKYTIKLIDNSKIFSVNSDVGVRPVSAYIFKKILESYSKPYIELSYIHLDGNQYINTLYIPNQSTKCILDANITYKNETYAIFGSRKSISGAAYTLWYINTYFRYDYRIGDAGQYTTRNFSGRHTIETNKNKVVLDGKTIITISTVSNFDTTNPLALASTYSNTTYGDENNYDTRRMIADVYSFKVYDNEQLVRDYIPVKMNDGQVGLYDLVENKFYGNSGTGSITAGPEL